MFGLMFCLGWFVLPYGFYYLYGMVSDFVCMNGYMSLCVYTLLVLFFCFVLFWFDWFLLFLICQFVF